MDFLPQASTYASSIDNLIIGVGIVVGIWFFLCQGLFFWMIWKFRARPGVKTEYWEGHEKKIKNWITYPHLLVLVCDVFIVWGSIAVWYEVKQKQL